MPVGLLFAIGACFVWGFIFVIPQYLSDFSSVEVVLGRYLSYGLLSTLLFFRRGWKRLPRYPLKIWGVAFLFALLSNLVYYLGLVTGLRFASPTLTVLIVGMAPIVIALYGNWQAREIAYGDLMLPCISIAFGLVLVNVTEVDWSFAGQSFGQYLLGWLGILAALLAWCWYAVQNARFLKSHPHIAASEWSTVMGVATLFWSLLVAVFSVLFFDNALDVAKFFTLSSATLRYLVCAAILGILCSWLGCFLWSLASSRLPISLMGPLLIFETLFGLLFVFLFQRELPSLVETVGVCAMVGGILMSVHLFRKKRII